VRAEQDYSYGGACRLGQCSRGALDVYVHDDHARIGTDRLVVERYGTIRTCDTKTGDGLTASSRRLVMRSRRTLRASWLDESSRSAHGVGTGGRATHALPNYSHPKGRTRSANRSA
jgi:hypothetical protein